MRPRDPFGRRRIDQHDDWVRNEIELSLHRGKIVIPIIFGEEMIPAEALPESIATLVEKQAAFVREAYLERDLEPVLSEVQRLLMDSSSAHVTPPTNSKRLPYPRPPMKYPPAPISEEELELVVTEELPKWDIAKGPVIGKPGLTGVELHRDLVFNRFKDAITFMSIVADFVDKANHHPRWENIYKTVSIHLTTWDIQHRISNLDLMVAYYIDKSYEEFLKRGSDEMR